MDRERTHEPHDPHDPHDPHWDREQVAPDGGSEPKEPQGKTWERHEWASDTAPGNPEDAEDERATEGPGAAGPTGKGMPSGESHWQRVDKGR
jgi:hypothetical protein